MGSGKAGLRAAAVWLAGDRSRRRWDVGRHGVTVLPMGAAAARGQRLGEEAAGEAGRCAIHVEGQDHAPAGAGGARRVAADGGTEGGTPGVRPDPVGGEHVVLGEDVEGGERRAAGQRIAGVAVGMQEAAGGVVVVEGGEDVVGGEHDGQRQVAAGRCPSRDR